ncbi:ATP-binding protein [Acidobacteria bacterium AH-259-D05]|nr:ATP-binding protein [Acidobacteria bacterium AH-259-D05]
MLFSKPINDITYDDVASFCGQGHKEGFILEYKQDFPSNNEVLAKTIAAFANTYGGILIIGIKAPAGEPLSPFEGITYDPSLKYEEKIEGICLAHIKEPVFPAVRVCPPQNGKTFVVIRVEESPITPHRTTSNTRIYTRTGQSSTPNGEASWEKIEWLVTRRKKSLELRERLDDKAEEYFNNACALKGINISNIEN